MLVTNLLKMIKQYKKGLLILFLFVVFVTFVTFNHLLEGTNETVFGFLQRFHFGGRVKTRVIGYDYRRNPCADVTSIVPYATFFSEPAKPIPSRRCIHELNPNVSSLTCDEEGRLGNQMFCYAILFTMGIYNSRSAHMSPTMSKFLSKYFILSLDTLDSTLFEATNWTNRKLGGNPPPDIKNLPNTTHDGSPSRIKFCCYPHIWKYFHELRPQLLNEFKFYPEIQNSTEILLAEAKIKLYPNVPLEEVSLIGIHVRRGDYLREQQSFGFDMPTVEFYKSAMVLFSKVKNPLFIFASNDIPWCEETFSGSEYKTFFVEGTSEENGGFDLAVLVNCDHVIFSLGTFGFWAAYLNPGKVVYCSDCVTSKSVWMNKGRVHDGDYGNFVLPSWIGISRNGSSAQRKPYQYHNILPLK